MSGAFRNTLSDKLLLNFRLQKDGTLGFDLFGHKVLDMKYYHVDSHTSPVGIAQKKPVCANISKNKKVRKNICKNKKKCDKHIPVTDVTDERLISQYDPSCDFKFSSSNRCGYSKFKCRRCQHKWPTSGTKGYKPKYCTRCAFFINVMIGTKYEYLCRTYAWDNNMREKIISSH